MLVISLSLLSHCFSLPLSLFFLIVSFFLSISSNTLSFSFFLSLTCLSISLFYRVPLYTCFLYGCTFASPLPSLFLLSPPPLLLSSFDSPIKLWMVYETEKNKQLLGVSNCPLPGEIDERKIYFLFKFNIGKVDICGSHDG